MPNYLDPPGYADEPKDRLIRIVNGCGPDDWRAKFIPDELLDVDMREACNRHDYDYYLGLDRDQADARLLANLMIACVIQHPGRVEEFLPLAGVYYLAVHHGGSDRFGIKTLSPVAGK